MYTELLGQNKVGFIIRTLYRIILFTFLLELLGALFIYLSVDASMFKSTDSRIFFAVFHSIAAFCNAGFSTLPDNLHSPEVRYNYNIQFIIAIIIILGGLGFGVLYNIWFYLQGKLAALISNTFYRETVAHKPWLLNLNTRLVLTMTAILVAGGTALLFLLEYNNLLAEHSSPWGKFVTAFFGAVTPRTAGFNNVDMASFSLPSIMLIMLLMWIGASPSSTGGGIRTTTFAVASLNILNLARESDRIELFKREISNETVRSAFAIVSLSLIVIGMASFGLTLSDGDKPLLALIFECISAFGTVGLTLGITTEMSSMGKLILTLTMFIGRVGPLTLILAMVVKAKTRHYHYPKEKLTLN